MELTEKQITKLREERETMQDTQRRIMNMERPSRKDHLCERGTLQKLHSLQNSQWLFGWVNWPYKKYEELLEKYRYEYFISWATLRRKDGQDYVANRGLVDSVE